MSRSFRKNAVTQIACGKDNPAHIDGNRRYRRHLNQLTHLAKRGLVDFDNLAIPPRRQFSNPYDWPSDGGTHFCLPHQHRHECYYGHWYWPDYCAKIMEMDKKCKRK